MDTEPNGTKSSSDHEKRQATLAAAPSSFRPIPVLMAIGLVLAGLYSLVLAQTLIIPLVLSVFLGLGLNPLVAFCARAGMPRSLSASVIMLLLTAGIAGAVWFLAPQAVDWVQHAPEAIRGQLAPKLQPLVHSLAEANRATRALGSGTGATAVEAPTVDVGLWDVVSIAPAVLAFAISVGLLVFFFLVYGDRMLRKLVEVSPSWGSKREVVNVVRDIQSAVSQYVFARSVLNVSLGAVTAALLWWLGLSDPLLWGALTALANFVPYIGPIVMTAVLAFVGILQFDDLAHALAPAAAAAALGAVEGNVITPLIMGRSMRLSPVAILIWLLIWAWLWGIAGALLAVPMLTSMKLVAERVDGLRWLAHIVSR